ncbi:MAG: PHB depolymerase family esterase [Nitrobacter sp.]
MSLRKNMEFLRRLPKINALNGFGTLAGKSEPGGGGSSLTEVTGFGTNPGDLRMFSFAPGDHRSRRKFALVLVLHGCGQTAAGYDVGAGWSMLAKRYGFALLMPQQKSSNNANGCFNWFNPEDTTRDSGEACSIRQMIEKMARDHNIDRSSIFVTGLSAGGAMTSVMLATYPEVFAGGAIIAGLPYGVATNVSQALNGMFQAPEHSARQLGDLVRSASGHKGPWPKLSIWHGSADKTVNPTNAREIIKQWVALHDLPTTSTLQSTVDGYPHQAWWNADGETVIESYTITGMAHGTPLGLTENDEHYGAAGAFLIEAGISSSYHIARFFGLTEGVHTSGEVSKKALKLATTEPADRGVPATAAVQPAPELVTMLWPRTAGRRPSEPASPVSKRPMIDVNAVITRALTAAGLMK